MKRIRAYFTLFVVLVFSCTVFSSAFVSAESAVNIPGKPSSGVYAVDLSGVVLPETVTQLTTINDSLAEGYEIYVVTVNSTGTSGIAEFSKNIFTSWEIGGADETGLLFVMDLNSTSATGQTYYALAGKGFGNFFSGGALQTIFTDFVEPQFAAANYDGAVSQFLTQASARITNMAPSTEVSPSESTAPTEESGIMGSIWSVVSVILIIILILVVLAIAAVILLNIRANNIKKKRREHRRASGESNHEPRQRRPRPSYEQQEIHEPQSQEDYDHFEEHVYSEEEEEQ